MIKTILFDADGVVAHAKMANVYFEETYGINKEITREFYRGPFSDCLVGKQDMYDVLPEYLVKWGWRKTAEEFVKEWFDYENSVDETLLSYVQMLRNKGIKCYVATNQEKYRADYMLKQMGFESSFDGLFASAHVGHKKPEPDFYKQILNKLEVKDPDSVLFIDDSLENVEAAQKLGFKGIYYEGFKKFINILERDFREIV
jgi:putative hydrolase of the HAD superfamily